MTLLESVYTHPVWTVVLLLAAGRAVAFIVEAAVEPFRAWRKPGDCPRCEGTGREPS